MLLKSVCDIMLRGGDRLTRSGDRLARGGDRLLRGGDLLLRGGDRLARGGDLLLRGGDLLLRGGDRLGTFFNGSYLFEYLKKAEEVGGDNERLLLTSVARGASSSLRTSVTTFFLILNELLSIGTRRLASLPCLRVGAVTVAAVARSLTSLFCFENGEFPAFNLGPISIRTSIRTVFTWSFLELLGE